ncbi:heparinase II/III family protein [Fulvivirgaceae bacterium PWU4]|uniref:Heparinase II/III family protein n=1 Tax=Chryseosolibacter histidini TaxID=2782349 RepID=A0AAP2DQN3_9BACT|nr:alginate lyase family protein [Chryseosolibacter histidini]MBT1699568.1 heparinase II/III family protein [Chryseosolibacter histidini]
MIDRLIRIFHTLRYLKPVQLYYRVYFVLARKRVVSFFKKKLDDAVPLSVAKLTLHPFSIHHAVPEGNRFVFLNLEKDFGARVDWNYAANGKLWNYKLNYFEFVNDEKIDKAYALALITDYCKAMKNIDWGLEPYPISLRGMNWIRFFVTHKISDPQLNRALYWQFKMLYYTVEYHLLGNHLMENGFALLFGAYYFRDEKFYKKATRILKTELAEQTLADGAHFERSPMYHCILLHRVLDAYNLVASNPWKQDELQTILKQKAAVMAGWLKQMQFSNGDLPQVNDTVEHECEPSVLFQYAQALGIQPQTTALGESGYRMIRTPRFELLIDVGNIGPDYIPGHAHSDTFSFILYVDGAPQLVETGTSTYLPGERRHLERTTASHNTVAVAKCEQSDVWSTFRVGRRAKVISLKEEANAVTATHDGYRSIGVLHERSWTWTNDSITITDKVTGNKSAEAYIHFPPGVQPRMLDAGKIDAGFFFIGLANHTQASVGEYLMAAGFNKLERCACLNIQFTDRLETKISLHAPGQLR